MFDVLMLHRRCNNDSQMFIAPNVTREQPQSDFPSQEEIESKVGEAVRGLFARVGFKADPTDVEKFLAENDDHPATAQMPKAVEVAMRWAFGSVTRKHLEQIKTREDLDKLLRTIKEATEIAPTSIRTALKQFLRDLPRRGGPGREPKLNAEESAKVCRQILEFEVIHKYPHKKALEETSKLCPTLINKQVSPRTLDKAWSKRSEYLRDVFEK